MLAAKAAATALKPKGSGCREAAVGRTVRKGGAERMEGEGLT